MIAYIGQRMELGPYDWKVARTVIAYSQMHYAPCRAFSVFYQENL